MRQNLLHGVPPHVVFYGSTATPRLPSLVIYFLLFRHARNLFAACFLNLTSILVSRPIRQALTFDAFHGSRRPFSIVNAKARAVIVSELKFAEIAL